MQVTTPEINKFQASVETRKMNLISPVIINGGSRGLKFLDLVKSNKLNVSPQLNKRMNSNKNIVKDLMKRKDDESYLKFSNNVPNPTSSPSSSILSKRKAVIETPDSPMDNSAKRKRVSFNDPVSTTKEYLITVDEERHKSNSLIRCLRYDENMRDEDEEIEGSENKENIVSLDKDEIKIENENEIKEESSEDSNSICLDHDYYEHDENPQNTDITTSSLDDEEILEKVGNAEISAANNKLTFNNKTDLMDYITKNVSIDEIFEKLTQAEEETMKRKEIIDKVLKTLNFSEMLNKVIPLSETKHSELTTEQLEATSCIVNHISKLMKLNDRMKHKVLDTLSEKHSKDFLSHALQENSTSTVCEKVTIPNIINYLIHKVNVCDNDDDIDFEINRLNRAMMHFLIKKTSNSRREIISDQKETQELLKLLFKGKQKIDVLDTVHEFLRSNIVQDST